MLNKKYPGENERVILRMMGVSGCSSGPDSQKES
jgi:hypothetical protein